MVREKKAATKPEASVLNKALAIASNIEVPAESLLKESTAEDARKVVELGEGIQELVKTGDLLKNTKEVQKGKAVCLETACSEATETQGNNSPHTVSNDITELESISTSHSSDTIDDIPLSKVYKTLEKSLAPSPSTKNQKQPDDDVFVPMYPFVVERIGHMAQMRINVCQKLPVNHHLKPPFIQPLQTIHTDAQFESEPTGPTSDIPETTTSSQSQPTTQTSDPSVLEELSNHFKGELPGFQPTLEKASETVLDTSVS